MKTLVVGMWEVGRWLLEVLKEVYECVWKDIEDIEVDGDGQIDFMHICFPHFDWFVAEVERLQEKYKPFYTVIHSTVPVGTTELCADFFSPVVGKHPNLQESIATFKKGIAGDDLDTLEKYFNKAEIQTERFSSTNALEFSKIMCTTRYWVDICFMKRMEKVCKDRWYNFQEVYTNRTKNYNEGYLKMGCLLYRRPMLIPMEWKIGGHCVVPNTKFEDNMFTDFVKKFNETI